ncbi:MAG TPA: twin-arginine translocase TatA/TatE family subunit [Candidatus Acidoferrales bacterium]|nr:twin-arginine translocase TatA/TatE family subunit [Candidatus Acidoferrales bacterium]
MPDIGPMEIILVLAIALLVLGPSKLPEIGKSLGSSIREFRKAAIDVQESVRIDPSARPSAVPVVAAIPQAEPAAVGAVAEPQSASSAEPQAGA